MLPISLSIKGMYSYQQETTIDFTNLTAAGLFGIFGAVGSGKSTILEAISFALYGETERLNSRDSRSYNMMNLKSNEMSIDFIFSCGEDNDRYRFTVNTKRNKKKYTDAGTIERKAFKQENNKWIPTLINTEEILGLSYQNFKRTVIIPQGKFQEFLQLKDTERTQMLKEIFNLQKYDLSNKVSRLTSENNLKISSLQGQMMNLPEYDEELLTSKTKEISELKDSVVTKEKQLNDQKEKESALSILKLLFAELRLKQKAFDDKKKEENTINELANAVAEYEKCEQFFKAKIDSRAKLITNIKTETVRLSAKKDESQNISTLVQIEEDKAEKLKESYLGREILLKKAEELKKIVQIKTLEEEKNGLDNRIKQGQIKINEEEEKLQAIKQEINELRSVIENEDKELLDADLLNNLSNWFKNKNQLENNINTETRELDRLKDETIKIKSEIGDELLKLSSEKKQEGIPVDYSIINIQSSKSKSLLEQEEKCINDKLSHLKINEKLDEFAKALKAHDECPLCGSIEHPKVFSAKSTIKEKEQLQNELENLKEKQNDLNSALQKLSGFYASLKGLSGQIDTQTSKIENFNTQIHAAVNNFSFEGYTVNDEDKVKTLSTLRAEKNQQLINDKKNLKELEVRSETTSGNVEKFKKAIEQFLSDKSNMGGQITVLRNLVSILNVEDELLKSIEAISAEGKEFHKEHLQITNDYEGALRIVHDNKPLSEGLKATVEEISYGLKTITSEKQELDRDIEALVQQNGYDSEDWVITVLQKGLDVAHENKKIGTYRRDLHALAEKLNEASEKIKGKEYNEVEHTALINAINDLTNDFKGLNDKLVGERKDLSDLKINMGNRKQLQVDLDKLNLRAGSLEVLSKLFRSSGFVNYVSSVYLQNLINAANERFHKITRQKLMLELGEGNSFNVRDFMSDGQVRSVKTLSGGQTFQAALSLALALADNIPQLTKSNQNFFFLDEGFGVLDKDSLDIIFDTLKNLRKENRIVGVISHENEMQQEIQVNLQVTNDPELGSLIKYSWS